MPTGAVTEYIDVAQIALYAFWIFFAGLIYYLRREDKREGYPLESDRSGSVNVQGWPAIPRPKTFLLRDGSTRQTPRPAVAEPEIRGEPSGPWPGAPLQPTGNPMVDAVGPAAYAQRAEVPDLTVDGEVKIVPMRLASGYVIESYDPDPRGMTVVGVDGVAGGVVRDIWVDRSEVVVRYLEVDTDGGRRVLLPMYFAKVDRNRRVVDVRSIRGDQFADAPGHLNPDSVTFREEDRIAAYYGAGHLYAVPSRFGPLL